MSTQNYSFTFLPALYFISFLVFLNSSLNLPFYFFCSCSTNVHVVMPIATTFSPYFKTANKEHFGEKFGVFLSTLLKTDRFGDMLKQSVRLTGGSPFSRDPFSFLGSCHQTRAGRSKGAAPLWRTNPGSYSPVRRAGAPMPVDVSLSYTRAVLPSGTGEGQSSLLQPTLMATRGSGWPLPGQAARAPQPCSCPGWMCFKPRVGCQPRRLPHPALQRGLSAMQVQKHGQQSSCPEHSGQPHTA